jgi:dephospho-CoA kinase
MAANNLQRIGLTGGIGSGKSTVGKVLTALGAHLVDADAISRALTAPGGAAMPAIVQTFGPQMADQAGGMNRPLMRHLAFADASVRQQLEAILHPLIGQQVHAAADQARPGQRVVLDVPLMVESLPHWRPLVDRIVVVDCLPETQIQRVMARSGWSRDAVEQVLMQQAKREHRLAVADHVLHNEGLSLKQLEQQVQALWELWNNAA